MSGAPSGRSPFPASRNPRNRRTSLAPDSFQHDDGSSHSPFLNNLLRFSPKASISPLGNRGSVTNAGTQQRRTRFFDSAATAAPSIRTVDSTGSSVASSTDVTTKPAAAVDLQDGIPIEQLKILAQQLLLSSPEMAAFYAGILYAKTGTDGLLLAEALAAAGQLEACLRIIEEANLRQDAPWEAVLIAAKALSGKRDWTALIEILEDMCRMPDPMITPASARSPPTSNPLEDSDIIGWATLKRSIKVGTTSSIHPLSMVCFFRANAYFETGCGFRASTYWKLALKMDCRCQQAWDAIQEKKLLSPKEAYDLVTRDIEFPQEHEWLRSFYMARIEVTTQDSAVIVVGGGAKADDVDMIESGELLSPIAPMMSPAETNTRQHNDEVSNQIQADVNSAFLNLWEKHKLQESPQILAMAARRAYRNYDWKGALEYCKQLAEQDPTIREAAFCYISCLVILGHKRELFRLAHQWVEVAPKSARAWFAVGAYYYCIERFHIAQRHFSRATKLDPQCSEAWIAFGCSFAACDESDQALASFRAAQRLSPGDHSALMYMGMEYVRTNHLPLASHFLESALASSGNDPLCLHEMGVLCMLKGDNNEEAISWFRRALTAAFGQRSLDDCIERCNDPYWEPTLFNLGHCYRRLDQLEEAETCYRRCNALRPHNHSSLAALAFVNLHTDRIDEAIEYFHKALSVKPNDSLSTDMLTRVLKLQVPNPVQKTDLRALASRENKRHVKPNISLSSAWGLKDDSLMSEGTDSDIDMSGD